MLSLLAFNLNSKDDSEEIMKARCHYRQAEIDGRVIVNLYDDAYVKVSCYCTCCWCYYFFLLVYNLLLHDCRCSFEENYLIFPPIVKK